MELLKAIHERRSVRKYKADPVPDEIIREILEAARQAPSWANTQVSRYIVVKEQTVKNALQDTLTPNNPSRAAIVDAPCVICVIAKTGMAGYYKGQPSTNKGDWFMFDAGIAMEHIVLAAWSFGLGTVHVGNFDAAKAEEALKIPEGFSIVEMTPLGYFDEIPKAVPRRALKESAFLNAYGTPYGE
ncbi:MAG TPA: nitroreductase family protein [Syntrophorhabdaceae bacterium]|jgi:nitroreductase